jgi:hypothetical protein
MSAPQDGAGTMQIQILHGHIVLQIVARSIPVIEIDAAMVSVLRAASEIREARTGNFDVTQHNAVGGRGDANSCVVIPRRVLHVDLDAVEDSAIDGDEVVLQSDRPVHYDLGVIAWVPAGRARSASCIGCRGTLDDDRIAGSPTGPRVQGVRIGSASDTHGRTSTDAGPLNTSQIAPRVSPTRAVSRCTGAHKENRRVGMDRYQNDQRDEVLRGGSAHFSYHPFLQD